jgi:type IV fimbrial biogenesis protein FimT
MLKQSMRRMRGATLLEMMITVAILAILAATAMPQMSVWIQRYSLISTAEIMQNGLRQALSEAVRRNAPVAFVLTNATPSASNVTSAAAAANGQNWMVRALDSSYAILASNAYVNSYRTAEASASIETTGPATIIFNGMGRVLDSTGTLVGSSQIYRLSRDDSTQVYCVFVTPGGGVKMCDPAVSSGKPQACQPQLTTAQCPAAGS